MKIIGLCGGSGSGKGSVCDIFRENHIPTVDTDLIYRELTSRSGPCLDALTGEFGSDIINKHGAFNRRALADIVFSGADADKRLERLNKISHKFILDETRARLEEYRNEGALYAVVDAPVLFESGFNSECDFVVAVIADREKRIDRIIARDGLNYWDAERRIKNQIPDKEIISRSDFVINNNSSIENLRDEVLSVLSKIKNK